MGYRTTYCPILTRLHLSSSFRSAIYLSTQHSGAQVSTLHPSRRSPQDFSRVEQRWHGLQSYSTTSTKQTHAGTTPRHVLTMLVSRSSALLTYGFKPEATSSSRCLKSSQVLPDSSTHLQKRRRTCGHW